MFSRMKTRVFVVLCLSLLTLIQGEAREVGSVTGEWDFAFESGDVKSVVVPHTWNAEDGADGDKEGEKSSPASVQGEGYKRGTGIYMKELAVAPKAGKRYFVRFEGASIVADVDINGKPVGRHEGAFGAFCFEITNYLEKNKNTLMVKVDNKQREHILPLSGDFTMFGGLYRPVALIETDAVCIKPDFYASPGVFITQEEVSKDSARIKVRTLLSAVELEAKEAAVVVEIMDDKGNVVAKGKNLVSIKPSEEMEDHQEFVINSPHLWQGRKDPYLYSVKVAVSTDDGQRDEVVQPLGIRSVAIEAGKGFVLNGEILNLKGVCRHQDRKGRGWALSREEEREDIEMICEMGAEAVRTAHYPQSRHIYDLCNKRGLLVWAEVPAVERVGDSPEFIANLGEQAREMVYQLGNNPSIVMWGLFNEIYHNYDKRMDGVDVEGVLEKLNKLIKELDPTRPTVAATNQLGREKLNRIPENIAINIYPGWYGSNPDGMKGAIENLTKRYSGMGTAISEYGHGASIYHHENPAMRPKPDGYWHPEEWQAIGHERNYAGIKATPVTWGTYVWNMFDFASDARKEGDQYGINDKGLVTYDRKVKKDAFFFYKANWNPELMAHITSRRFASRTQEDVPVKVYSNADKVELSVNGKTVGMPVAPDDLKRAVWDKVKLKPGKNIISVKATKGDKIIKDSCEWTYKKLNLTEPVETDRYEGGKR